MNKKYTADLVQQMSDIDIKVAGAITQAGVENQRGSFNLQRQSAFVSFINKQDFNSSDIPDQVWADLYDILIGM